MTRRPASPSIYNCDPVHLLRSSIPFEPASPLVAVLRGPTGPQHATHASSLRSPTTFVSSSFPLLCLGNYSPIHLPVLCLDQPIMELPLLCAIFPLVSCFLCSTLLLVLGCALLSNYKTMCSCSLHTAATRPQWREHLSVAGEYDPKIDPKQRIKDQQTRNIQTGSVAIRKTLWSKIR